MRRSINGFSNEFVRTIQSLRRSMSRIDLPRFYLMMREGIESQSNADKLILCFLREAHQTFWGLEEVYHPFRLYQSVTNRRVADEDRQSVWDMRVRWMGEVIFGLRPVEYPFDDPLPMFLWKRELKMRFIKSGYDELQARVLINLMKYEKAYHRNWAPYDAFLEEFKDKPSDREDD